MIIIMMMMIIIIIVIIIVIIIIIAFKGAIRDFFYNLLTAPRTVSNTYAQVTRAQSCANHVQHVERLSRATCRVTCHVVRRNRPSDTHRVVSHVQPDNPTFADLYW